MPDIKRPDTESRLDLLRRKLYNREATGFEVRRSRLLPGNYDEPRRWEEAGATPAPKVRASSSSRWLSYFLIGALVFFLVALMIGGIVFFRGINVISGSNINLTIRGPISIRAGNVVDLQVIVENGNQTALRFVDVVVEFPPGTRSPGNIREPLIRAREMIGDINPGETVNRTIKAILFGGEGSNQEVKIILAYRIPGSEVIFEKKKTYSLAISSSPINIVADLPAEVLTNQEIELKIKTLSNSEALLKNVLLTVSYPPGFRYLSANIKPLAADNIWSLGDVQSGDEREIVIKGILTGSSDDVRSFRIVTGSQDEANIGQVLVAYGEIIKTITVKKPFLEGVVTLNKEDVSEYILNAGQMIRGEINYANSFSNALSEVVVKMKFAGSVLDRRSVIGDNGFYDSINNEITWDKNSVPALSLLAPGDHGVLAFTFATLKADSTTGKDPVFKITTTLTGNRTEEGFIGYPTQTVVEKIVKIQSALQLATRSLYQTGPFENSGPIPPVVEQETSYSIVWAISNSSSDMKGVEIRGRLPQYVKWLGNYVPTNEAVNYNPATREVVWSPGYIKAGTGRESAAREITFQVSLTPSLSQIDLSPILVDTIRVNGVDSFTGVRIGDLRPPVTTELSTEAGFTLGQAKVVAP